MKKVLILMIFFCCNIFADLDNAKANLNELSKELNLDDLEFDENDTCILEINNTFSLHLTYITNADRLYLYSPLLDGLPKDDRIRLKLYERLLEGSMLGHEMAAGGVGLDVKEDFIVMHCVLDMGLGVDPSALKHFFPLFVETVEKWRKIVSDICEGKDIVQRVERRNLR